MKNRLKITIINDEISDDLYETIKFLKLHHIENVELRTIKKKNFIDYSLNEVRDIYSLLLRNGINVSAIASPLFKWYPQSAPQVSSEKVDTFHFNPNLRLEDKKHYIKKAIALAKTLKTQNIRIFSSLKTHSAQYSFIKDPLLEFILDETQKEGLTLLLENEPTCYISRIKDIKHIARKFSSKNLGIWFDVSNFYKIGEQVFLKDLKELKNHIQYFHLKDFDESGNYVPLGDGIINYKRIISDIRNVFSDTEIYLSLEAHVLSDSKSAIAQSLQTLNKLLSEKRVKYGIIGCGQTFIRHASAISKNKQSELRAVFDIKKKRMQEVALQFDCEAKRSPDELLDDATIDVVNIRTPNDTHMELVLKTLEKGKYCLCEKPLCLTTAEGQKILRSKHYKNNVIVNFQNRFNPAIQRLFEYLEAGKFGKIIFCSIDVRWWRDNEYFKNWHGNLKRVGGMLFNQGAHAIDLILKICGPVKNITKLTKSLRKFTKIDDIYLALLEFQNRALGKIEVTTYTKYKNCEATIFVIGEKGSIKIDGPSFNKINFLSFKEETIETVIDQAQENDAKNSHLRLIKALNDYILNGRKDKHLVFAEDSIKVTELIEKLYH